jgi:hypothetical protein
MTIRPQNEGRDFRIWMARVEGSEPAEIAEKFGMSVWNVHNRLKLYAASIPNPERAVTEKMRRSVLDKAMTQAMKVLSQPPKKRYAPNGKQLDGEDYSEILAAVDRVAKLDERIARLTGTDNAIQHQVSVSAEAAQAVQEAADKALEAFPSIAGVVPAGSG